MRKVLIIIAMLMAGCVFFPTRSLASDTGEGGEINVQHIIFEHMLDSYSWHITKIGEKDVVIYFTARQVAGISSRPGDFTRTEEATRASILLLKTGLTPTSLWRRCRTVLW